MSPNRRLTESEYTILGVIEDETSASGTIHGYDLHRALTDGVVATIIRIEPGMVYHYLKKLTRQGYIETTVIPQDGRPDRHEHTLNDQGRDALNAWISEPVETTRDLRLGFLLKVWFATQRDADLARRLVDDQAAIVQSLIERLQTQRASITDPADFRARVLDLRIAQNTAAESWLREMQQRTPS